MTPKTWFITGTSRGFGREWTILILVLEAGQVVERGTHEELLRKGPATPGYTQMKNGWKESTASEWKLAKPSKKVLQVAHPNGYSNC